MKAALFALALALGSCVVVEDDPRECSDGDFSCSNDDTVDICVDGYWEVYEDCWDGCNGPAFCAYDTFNDPVCVCK